MKPNSLFFLNTRLAKTTLGRAGYIRCTSRWVRCFLYDTAHKGTERLAQGMSTTLYGEATRFLTHSIGRLRSVATVETHYPY